MQQQAKEQADILNMLADRWADAQKASVDAADSRRDAIRAEDQGILELRKTYADYYSWQRDVIEELARLDTGSINDRRDAELAALSARQKADEAQLKQLHASPAERAQLEQSYASERVSIEQAAANQIVAIEKKKNADLAQAEEEFTQNRARAVALTDGLRQGLESVGLAARKGFGSLKDAAAQALDQVADLIMQLYVMKPLLDSLFGPSGSAGGGLIGSLLKGIGIPGFANGTPSAPGGLAWVGERGKELVNLPKGSQVIPNNQLNSIPTLPNMAGAGRGGSVVQNFDLRGAVVTERLYEDMQTAAAQHAASALEMFDSNYLPARVAQLVQDPRLR